MLKNQLLAAIISYNLILCIIIIVSLSPNEVECRNPKPSLCNTFGGCGLGRMMRYPTGISQGKTEKAEKISGPKDDDDDDDGEGDGDGEDYADDYPDATMDDEGDSGTRKPKLSIKHKPMKSLD